MVERRVQVLHSAQDQGRGQKVERLPQQPLDRPRHDGLPLPDLLPHASSGQSCPGTMKYRDSK